MVFARLARVILLIFNGLLIVSMLNVCFHNTDVGVSSEFTYAKYLPLNVRTSHSTAAGKFKWAKGRDPQDKVDLLPYDPYSLCHCIDLFESAVTPP